MHWSSNDQVQVTDLRKSLERQHYYMASISYLWSSTAGDNGRNMQWIHFHEKSSVVARMHWSSNDQVQVADLRRSLEKTALLYGLDLYLWTKAAGDNGRNMQWICSYEKSSVAARALSDT